MDVILSLLRITFSCTFSELLGSCDFTEDIVYDKAWGYLNFLIRRVSYRLVYDLDIKVGTSFYFCKETSSFRNIICGFVSVLVFEYPVK